MQQKNHVQFWRDTAGEMEAVLCSKSQFSYPKHHHVSSFVIGMVLEGDVHVEAACMFGDEQCFAIPPYVPHSITAGGPYTLFSLCIHRRLFCALPPERLKAYAGLAVRRIFGAGKIPKRNWERLARRLDDCRSADPVSPDPFLLEAKRLLESLPEESHHLEKMAHAAFMSPAHFIREFQHEWGLTPHQFQVQSRVRMVQRLLRQGETITKAALIAGFCDQSHLIKQFRRLVGMTPSAYRNSCDTVSLFQEESGSGRDKFGK